MTTASKTIRACLKNCHLKRSKAISGSDTQSHSATGSQAVPYGSIDGAICLSAGNVSHTLVCGRILAPPLTALETPEGERVPVSFFWPIGAGQSCPEGEQGFLALLETDIPTEAGERSMLAATSDDIWHIFRFAPRIFTDSAGFLDAAFALPAPPAGFELIFKKLAPELASGSGAESGPPEHTRQLEFGDPPAAPECSLVIPVDDASGIDIQMAAFAQDDFITGNCQIIYALANPARYCGIVQMLKDCSAIFTLPVRVLRFGRKLSLAAAALGAARQSAGAMTAVLRPGTIPQMPGWLEIISERMKKDSLEAVIVGADTGADKDRSGTAAAAWLNSREAGDRKSRAVNPVILLASANAIRESFNPACHALESAFAVCCRSLSGRARKCAIEDDWRVAILGTGKTDNQASRIWDDVVFNVD